MVLPNFLIIGAHKAGTTWLTAMLATHPDIFMQGEIKFFSSPNYFAEGIDSYKERFRDVTQESAVGEKSPSYLCVSKNSQHQTHRYIYECLPTVKLIVVLRNPVDRAIAHARHYMREASIGSTISPFVSLDYLILESELSSGILERGYYARQLELYYEYFTPQQILVIVNEEEIVKDSKSLLKKVCNFLEVDADFEFQNRDRKIHDGSLSRLGIISSSLIPIPFMKRLIQKIDRHTLGQTFNLTVRKETVSKLYELYNEENERLFKLLNRRWSSWSVATKDFLD